MNCGRIIQESGREVVVTWGEEDGGSSKPIVERHVQTDIRAEVSTKRLNDR